MIIITIISIIIFTITDFLVPLLFVLFEILTSVHTRREQMW